MKTQTMYEKIWEAHLVRASADEVPILYIDTHLVHEVTSPKRLKGCGSITERSAVPI